MRQLTPDEMLAVEEKFSRLTPKGINAELLNHLHEGSLGHISRELGVVLGIVAYYTDGLEHYGIGDDKAGHRRSINWPVFLDQTSLGKGLVPVSASDHRHLVRMGWASAARDMEKSARGGGTSFARLMELQSQDAAVLPSFSSAEKSCNVLFSPMGEILAALLGWHLRRYCVPPNLNTKELLSQTLTRSETPDNSALKDLLTSRTSVTPEETRLLPTAWFEVNEKDSVQLTWSRVLGDIGLRFTTPDGWRDLAGWLIGQPAMLARAGTPRPVPEQTREALRCVLEADVWEPDDGHTVLRAAIDALAGRDAPEHWESIFSFNLGTHLFWLSADRFAHSVEPYAWIAIPAFRQPVPYASQSDEQRDTLAAAALVLARCTHADTMGDTFLASLRHLGYFSRLLAHAESRTTLYQQLYSTETSRRVTSLRSRMQHLHARSLEHDIGNSLRDFEGFMVEFREGALGNLDAAERKQLVEDIIDYELVVSKWRREVKSLAVDGGTDPVEIEAILRSILDSKGLLSLARKSLRQEIHSLPPDSPLEVRLCRMDKATKLLKEETVRAVAFLEDVRYEQYSRGLILPTVEIRARPTTTSKTIVRIILANLITNMIKYGSPDTRTIRVDRSEVLVSNRPRGKRKLPIRNNWSPLKELQTGGRRGIALVLHAAELGNFETPTYRHSGGILTVRVKLEHH